MGTNIVKIAVSLPREHFAMIEKLRRELDVPRSAIVDEAIRFWLEKRLEKEQAERYEAGYLNKPEKVHELKALEKAQLEILPEEEEW